MMLKITRVSFLCLLLIGSTLQAFLPCINGPFASNTAVNDCLNTPVNGSLVVLVSGGSGPLSFAPFGAPDGGSVSISSTGSYIFTPTAGFSGVGGFSYEVTDTDECTATGSVSVTVLSPIVLNETLIDCSATGVTGNLNSLVSSGFPPYTFASTGPTVGGSVQVLANGDFSFTPDINFNGAAQFSFQITDSNNCAGSGTITIAVGGPITEAAFFNTCNNSLSSSLTAFVTGGSGGYSFSGPVAQNCTGSSISVSPTGLFTYTAPTGFTGPCSFLYQVTDSNECSTLGSVQVTANVTPVAADQSFTICKNSSAGGSLSPLITGGIPPYNFTIVTQPTHGTVTLDLMQDTYLYQPNVGFVGVDSFQYQATDSSNPTCTSNIATVTIVVQECCSVVVDPSGFYQLVQNLYFPIE